MREDILVKVGADISDLSRDMDRASKEVSGFGQTMSGLGKTLAGVAATAATAFAGIGVATAKTGVQFNAMQEQSKVAWTTLLGSAGEAEKMLKRISDFAAKTQFDTQGVNMMATYFHNAGLAGDELFNTLTKVADVSGAFAIPAAEAQEMARQMSQVQQAGVAMTEDLNILQDRGVPIFKAIAEQMGVSVADVKKLASQSKITSDIYMAAFDDIAKSVEGSADRQSETFLGMISTIQDNIQILAGELTKGLFGKLKGGLSTALSTLETFNDALKKGGLGAAFQAILPPGVLERVQSFVDGVKPLLNEVTSFVMAQVGKLAAFWDSNGSQIMQSVSNVFNFIKSIMTSPVVLFVIQTIWGAIQNVIGGALDMIMGVVKIFSGLFTADWSQMWSGIKQLFSGAIDFISGIMTLQFFGGLKTIFTNLLKSGTGLMQSMWTSIVNFFKNFGSNVSATATEMVGKVIGYFKNLFTGATNIFGQLRTFGASVWNALKEAVISAARNIWSGVTQHFSDMASSVRNLMHNVKSSIVNIWNEAVAFLKGIDLTKIGKNIIQGLINGITGMASAVVDKVQDIGNSIAKTFKKVLGIHSPSRVMEDLAKYVPLGAIKGIESMRSDVLAATDKLAEWMTPDTPDVSLAYATPAGTYGTLSSAVSGTVDVNSRDDRLAAAIDRLERKLTNLTVEMDGRTVGQIVEPHITKVQETKTIRSLRAKGL
ncbi:tape measure protein [Caldifermentibacillus hisashii]|uniref:tape measure protein n=1 Tax=Caldifermentibacillus hisashii TaxID=996558 RepID=UPI0031FC77F4